MESLAQNRQTVYQQRATQSRQRNARIDARLTAEFAQRDIALQAKLDAIVAANRAKADEAWKASIEEAMDAIPENPADLFTPEQVGRFDFDEGRDCEPTDHYTSLSDCEAYIIGYKQGEREMEATEDYESDIEDRDFWSRGQW